MGDKPGHPFRGNQWSKGYGMPPVHEDPAPGKAYYYHATRLESLSSIANDGLVPPKDSQNAISLAPHLESAETWVGLIGGKEMALLRAKRENVDDVEIDSDGIDTGIPYDPNDEGAEVATYSNIAAEFLEVYHRGEWVDLEELVWSPQFKVTEKPSDVQWRANPAKRVG